MHSAFFNCLHFNGYHMHLILVNPSLSKNIIILQFKRVSNVTAPVQQGQTAR